MPPTNLEKEIREDIKDLIEKVQRLETDSQVTKLKVESMNILLKKLDRAIFGNGTQEDIGLIGQQIKFQQRWIFVFLIGSTFLGAILDYLIK